MGSGNQAHNEAGVLLHASVSEVLQRHRSVRRFARRDLPVELVQRVVTEAVAGTSSYGNLNCASVVATAEAERLASLRALHFDQPATQSAPLMLTVCADTYRLGVWLAAREARPCFDNLHGLAVGVVDACLLAQSIALGFEAAGLGICFLGTTLDACERIAQFLGLPKGCIPVTSLAVGYPADTPPKRARLPLDAQLFWERYPAVGDAQLTAWFAQREAADWADVLRRDPEASVEMARLGIENYAQYCTSACRYPPEESDATAQQLLRMATVAGFARWPGRWLEEA